MNKITVILPDGSDGCLDLDQVKDMSADAILRMLGRSEEELEALLKVKKQGGLPRTRLVNDLAMAKVVRVLKGGGVVVKDPKMMNMSDLTKEIDRRRGELYRLCQEKSRREGDMPKPARNVNFEKYVEE